MKFFPHSEHNFFLIKNQFQKKKMSNKKKFKKETKKILDKKQKTKTKFFYDNIIGYTNKYILFFVNNFSRFSN